MITPRKGQLGAHQLEFLAIGGTVGAGLFLAMGQGLRIAGPSMVLAYMVSGALLFVITRCLGEMALHHAEATPLLALTRRYVGKRTAFVQGWSYWACHILACMAELTAAGVFVHTLAPTVPSWVVAAGALTPLFAINRLRVDRFGTIEFWMALIKIVTIAAFLIVGTLLLARTSPGSARLTAIGPLWRDGGVFPTGAWGFLAALPTALFAFGGAELVGVAAPDAADPQHIVPRAINAVFLWIVLLYVGTTSVVICLFHWYAAPLEHSPIAVVFARAGVPGAQSLITMILVTAMLSACNSAIYASSRTILMLAEIGAAPRRLVVLNVHGSPEKALMLSIAVIAVTVLLDYFLPDHLFQRLLGMAAFAIVIDWAIVLVTHLRFRKRHARRPPAACRPPLAPWSNYAALAFIGLLFSTAAITPRLRTALILDVILFGSLVAIAEFRPGPSANRAPGSPCKGET